LNATMSQESKSSSRGPPLLVVVEGRNDIEFLRRISAILNAIDRTLPDLSALERRGQIVFMPFGGGELHSWAYRLAPLGKAEFHLYDREMPPLSDARFTAARIVNLRTGCRAFVTGKRSLENYLHPQAILEAGGIEIEIADDDDVAEAVAKKKYLSHDSNRNWLELDARCRRRLRNHVKQWLNRAAVDRITAELIAARDPDGEIRDWLAAIAEMAGCFG
jgi:putative ATP-dependent endonuclease of OLD family